MCSSSRYETEGGRTAAEVARDFRRAASSSPYAPAMRHDRTGGLGYAAPVAPGIHPVEVQEAAVRARAAWPALSLAEATFADHVARLYPEAPPDGWGRLHIADLYLACACSHGDAAALAACAQKLWPEIDAALARVRLPADKRQDVMQDLRVVLFV